MNQEQQRIKIAEACGFYKNYFRTGFEGVLYGDILCGEDVASCPVPDYLNDLNAMWKAVRNGLVGAKQLRAYEGHLHDLSPDYPTEAPAAQRAEAFLKTLGLWEDGRLNL